MAKRTKTEFKLTTCDIADCEDTQEIYFRTLLAAQQAAALFIADPGCGQKPLCIAKCDNRNGYWQDVETLEQFS